MNKLSIHLARWAGKIILCAYLFNPSLLSALTTQESKLIQHVKDAYNKAETLQSKLTPEVLELLGMSGWKVRHFLNNLCSLPDAVYLEIGCWQGSTLVSALYENNLLKDAIAIDNWSEFGGPRNECLTNIAHFIPNAPLQLCEVDCFSPQAKEAFNHPINIYFYDGNHDRYSQEFAFTFYNDLFENTFITVVDDWNWEHVRAGTMSAFQKLNYTVLYQKELYTDRNGDNQGWWNGLFIAVIRKN